ncbi:hypothetical protein L6452_16524 [Arctium lappa]|uniref:Uncharacterized protein n=2 Tax=Arctium lappa TaxID=4217 RepID=A0ACB9C0P4_ARCLA|nr:hypothetical protein L6452_16518 [Arctium lappa]KAI3727902.1 hypothetical protein L6452_16524 [Arctium lappa]
MESDKLTTGLTITMIVLMAFTSSGTMAQDFGAAPAPSPSMESAGTALFDLENTHQEFKSDLKDLYINSAKEDEMQQYLEIHRQHLKFHRHDAIILLRIQQVPQPDQNHLHTPFTNIPAAPIHRFQKRKLTNKFSSTDWDKAWSSFKKQGKKILFSQFTPDKKKSSVFFLSNYYQQQLLPSAGSGSSLQVLVHSLPQIAAAGTTAAGIAAAETAAAGTTA